MKQTMKNGFVVKSKHPNPYAGVKKASVPGTQAKKATIPGYGVKPVMSKGGMFK